jgi:RimJ/RimL family protein N-acetyltransferase
VTAAIAGAETGDYLGAVDLHIVVEDRRGHIGYLVAPWARRRGVAVRAVNLIVAHGFERLGLGRIEIVTHPDNLVSQRVAERAGFEREATLRSYLLHRNRRNDGVMFSRLSGTR